MLKKVYENSYVMKIQIASDLHIDYKNNSIDIDPFKYIEPEGDILILAGDIGSFYKITQLKVFLQKLSRCFEHIIYIPGNHEYYRVYNSPPKTMDELLTLFILRTKLIRNLHILNRSCVKFGHIIIAGCTLWSKIGIPLPKYQVKIHGMDTKKYTEEHIKDLYFIKDTMDACDYYGFHTIVVTHHCPTFDLMETKYTKAKNNSLYFSNLNKFIEKSNVQTWIYGHTHLNKNILIGNTNIICNQKGKIKDNVKDYKKKFTIFIDNEKTYT